MLLNALLFAGSMLGIIVVARFALYEPAQKLAKAARLSRSATGQLLGYLTSAPELVATVFVASTGLFTVVSYNILGSNIVNVGLAIVASVWFRQSRKLFGSTFRLEQGIILVSILVPIGLLVLKQDSALWSGGALFGGYIAYLLLMRKRKEPVGPVEEEDAAKPWSNGTRRVIIQTSMLIFGLVSLYFLGDVLGDSIYSLGVAFGVSTVLLGWLTAIATSLPELTTFFASFAAHRKAGTDGNSEVMHNIMASNVMNLFFIQALGVGVFYLFA